MTMIEPMTAAEYREMTRSDWGLTPAGRPILAALEERERLLGERSEWMVRRARAVEEVAEIKADAALGALVRRIREHPAFTGGVIWCRDESAFHFGSFSEDQLSEALSHLDSLVPKEPEVAPSGWRYGWSGDVIVQIDHIGRRTAIDDGPTDEMVPPCDTPVVAKLMAGPPPGGAFEPHSRGPQPPGHQQ